ncbi:TPA: hypothetical protein G8O67_004783 [Salmonella enterica]|uniref:Uncharacterized protein n=1 Tax=Salmonella enterica TaxID=28901 RepID=A0A756I668_SALER|nr:hypothetical protein [Salmonella enterica]
MPGQTRTGNIAAGMDENSRLNVCRLDTFHQPARFLWQYEVNQQGIYMGHHSSGLHLKVAAWILERGNPVCIYDVVKQFGVTVRQAIGLLSSVVTDSAIETQTGLIIPDRPVGRYRSKYVRTVQVLSIDYEATSRRKGGNQYHNYHAENHQPETVGEISCDQKWEWVLRNAIKRRRRR